MNQSYIVRTKIYIQCQLNFQLSIKLDMKQIVGHNEGFVPFFICINVNEQSLEEKNKLYACLACSQRRQISQIQIE